MSASTSELLDLLTAAGRNPLSFSALVRNFGADTLQDAADRGFIEIDSQWGMDGQRLWRWMMFHAGAEVRQTTIVRVAAAGRDYLVAKRGEGGMS